MSRRVQAFMKPYHDLLAKRGKLDERQENLEKRQKLLDAEIEKLDDQLRKLSIPRETFSMPDRLPAEQRKALNERRKELREQWEKLNKQRYEDLQKEEDDLTRQQDELDHPDEVNWSAPMQQGCEMALYLARWEPQAALPLLRRLTAIRRPTTTGPSSDAYFFPERFVAMTLARAAAGDLAGLEEYARWLRKAPPSSLRSSACAPSIVTPTTRRWLTLPNGYLATGRRPGIRSFVRRFLTDRFGKGFPVRSWLCPHTASACFNFSKTGMR